MSLLGALSDKQFWRDVGGNTADLAQSASNSAATNVSAPVDLITWLMNKAGANIKEPVGGSDWMKRVGLTRQVADSPAAMVGDALGMIAPMLMVEKAPQIAKGLLQAGENLAAPRTLNPQTGAIVWHGSPHKFDKFDAGKIGTGEGAQAYGHGLYLAESPEVATGYMNTLAGNVNTKGAGYYPKINGKVVYDDFEDLDLVRKIAAATEPKSGGLMGRGARPSVSSDTAIAELIAKNKAIANDSAYFPEARAKAAYEIEALNKYLGQSIEPSRASLYKVDLPDDAIAKMLDWDNPLSQQSGVMQMLGIDTGDALSVVKSGNGYSVVNGKTGEVVSSGWANEATAKKFAGNGGSNAEANLSGKDYYQNLGGGVAAAEKFKAAGIPGIRYLDGGSRGTGQGTSNFVVFPGNEGLLQILERNGQRLP